MTHKIPLFTDEMEAYIVEKLAAGKPLPKIAEALIQRYPEQFSDVEDCDLKEVKAILYGRLRNRKYDPRYSSYWKIKEEQEELESVLANIDIADPIQQLRILDHLDKQIAEAETHEEIDKLKSKIQTRLKIMADARKTVEMILPSGDDTFDGDDIPPVKWKSGE